MKVVERIDGDADPTRCREGTVPLAYPKPARLYCLEKAADGQAST